MIDCGFDISIIKRNLVIPKQIYYPSDTCKIIGIGEGALNSIGSSKGRIITGGHRIEQNFHIVNYKITLAFPPV